MGMHAASKFIPSHKCFKGKPKERWVNYVQYAISARGHCWSTFALYMHTQLSHIKHQSCKYFDHIDTVKLCSVFMGKGSHFRNMDL